MIKEEIYTKEKLLTLPYIKELIKLGVKEGQLSYDKIKICLPNDMHIDNIDNVLMLLSEFNIDLTDNVNKTKKKKAPSSEANEIDLDDHIKYYLKEVGKVSLLSQEDEQRLSKKIVEGEEKLKSVIFSSVYTLRQFLLLHKDNNKPDVFKIFDYDIFAYPNKEERTKLENKLKILLSKLQGQHNFIRSIDLLLKNKEQNNKNKLKKERKKLIEASLNDIKIAQLSFDQTILLTNIFENKILKYLYTKNNPDKNIEENKKACKEIEEELGGNKQIIKHWFNEIKEGKRIIDTAKSDLIKANLRLVISIAKRYVQRGIHFFDLIQEGNIGLMKAVDRFKYRRQYKFSTYSSWWIRQAITKSISKQKRLIRVPSHINEQIKSFSKAIGSLLQDIGREPSLAEISLKLNWDIEKVRNIYSIAMEPISLESQMKNNDDTRSPLINMIEDKTTPSAEQKTSIYMLRQHLDKVIETLPEREQTIIKLRFGLIDGHSYTLKEAGDKFNLSRERVRQIERRALKKLKATDKNNILKEYTNYL